MSALIVVLFLLAGFFFGWQVGLDLAVISLRHRGHKIGRVFGPLTVGFLLTLVGVVLAYA